MTDTYLDKLCQLKAIEISYESSSDAVRRSHYLISTLFTEIIETTILMYKLYLRLFASIPVSPGELDAET
ncbi:hypothetical protein GGF41_004114, partial [Coemansia sp. RSA 2531]